MTVLKWPITLAAVGILLAGCGGAPAPTTNSMPGMSMAPGQTMSGTSEPGAPATSTAPLSATHRVARVGVGAVVGRPDDLQHP